MSNKIYTCDNCGATTSEDYCPQCGAQIKKTTTKKDSSSPWVVKNDSNNSNPLLNNRNKSHKNPKQDNGDNNKKKPKEEISHSEPQIRRRAPKTEEAGEYTKKEEKRRIETNKGDRELISDNASPSTSLSVRERRMKRISNPRKDNKPKLKLGQDKVSIDSGITQKEALETEPITNDKNIDNVDINKIKNNDEEKSEVKNQGNKPKMSGLKKPNPNRKSALRRPGQLGAKNESSPLMAPSQGNNPSSINTSTNEGLRNILLAPTGNNAKLTKADYEDEIMTATSDQLERESQRINEEIKLNRVKKKENRKSIFKGREKEKEDVEEDSSVRPSEGDVFADEASDIKIKREMAKDDSDDGYGDDRDISKQTGKARSKRKRVEKEDSRIDKIKQIEDEEGYDGYDNYYEPVLPKDNGEYEKVDNTIKFIIAFVIIIIACIALAVFVSRFTIGGENQL